MKILPFYLSLKKGSLLTCATALATFNFNKRCAAHLACIRPRMLAAHPCAFLLAYDAFRLLRKLICRKAFLFSIKLSLILCLPLMIFVFGFYDSVQNALFIKRKRFSLRMHSPSHARGTPVCLFARLRRISFATQTYLSASGFIVGNNSTSLIAAESVRSIHILSIPKPMPPVGGIPISSAFIKSSSVVFASSSPWASNSS